SSRRSSAATRWSRPSRRTPSTKNSFSTDPNRKGGSSVLLQRRSWMFDVVVRTKAGKKLKGLRCPINECGIGKARDNLVQLRGWRIAPYHAVLQRTPEGLFIEDRSGNNDVRVNDKVISRYGPLHTADVITIGAYQIT